MASFPDYRQILIAQGALKMRKGKLAAQAAHASLAALLNPVANHLQQHEDGSGTLIVPLDKEATAWLNGAFKKICVKVDSESELLSLHERAKALNLRCALIRDNGLTEFGGIPTYTVLAIGPHSKEVLDPLTGHLTLY